MIDSEPKPLPVRRQPSAWNAAFVILLVTVLGFGFVAQIIGGAVGWLIYGGEFPEYAMALANPVGNERMRLPLMVAQAISTILGLAIIPPLFWWGMRRKSILTFFTERRVTPAHFLYTLGIVFFFLIVISVVVEWNSNLEYPGTFGVWAREIEDKAMELTKFMTSDTSLPAYLGAVLVIAIFAGIGEEIAFRGCLQTELQKAFGNPHAAIWTAAIFFSAFHLQFYGFFPRLLLGALFGYLYSWSGNLAIPIFAHFANNLFAVSGLYFGLEKADEQVVAPWYAVLISLVLGLVLLYRFRELQPKSVISSPPNDQPA
jgi:membrane protease YdiL (CAAX protease family)